MQVGVLGLGRMGANMARRLMRGGHTCVAYDREAGKVSELVREGAQGADSLDQFIAKLQPPRIVWMMLPAGETTAQAISALARRLMPRDTVIDGGNSHYMDDINHHRMLAGRGIGFVDCGTSGGIWGAERGYCLTIGGTKETVDGLDPLFRTLAPGAGGIPRTPGREGFNETAGQGYLYCGPPGAGHFAKMVHNGIEYGMMQSLAEGFDLLRNAGKFGYDFPLPDVAEVWRRGSVISSWLLDLTAMALAKSPDLAGFEGCVADSGEGR
jgi:6-phosphogluconate dehydrogenase